jgi:hypothetical protein
MELMLPVDASSRSGNISKITAMNILFARMLAVLATDEEIEAQIIKEAILRFGFSG